jgi:hypothetical protein
MLARFSVAAAATVAISCGGGGGGSGGGGDAPHDQPARVVKPPIVGGAFRYYSVDQGLPPDVRDVSADEGGNVYVAAVS